MYTVGGVCEQHENQCSGTENVDEKNQMDRGISGALQVHLKCLEEDIAALDSTMVRLKAQQRQQVSCMSRLLEKKSRIKFNRTAFSLEIHQQISVVFLSSQNSQKGPKLPLLLDIPMLKTVQLQGGFAPLTPDQGLCPWTPPTFFVLKTLLT